MPEVPDGPRTDDREAIEGLATALANAGYTSAALQETLALEGPFSRDPTGLPVYLRMLPADSDFSTLTKLFLLGVEVEPAEAARALAPVTAERLEAIGLVERTDAGLRSLVSILPWSGFLVVSDSLDEEIPPMRADHVLSVIPPSVTLASIVPRRQVDSLLDVGVGSGVQALLASKHARKVVGVDVNSRALRYAELNLILNRVSNVELRHGDLYEAVEGETFDLIVSNPPYVVSPEAHYAFRDSGLPGDTFCEALVRGAAPLLREDGLAVLLVSWVHGREEDWTAPVRRWVDGSGCDTLVFHYMSQDPLAYAALWNRPLRWDRDDYATALDRWLEYDRSLGIESIAWGALILRRRTGANWFAGHSTAMNQIDEAGGHIERIIEARDYLAGTDGDGLLATPLRLADDHRLDQTLMIRDGTGMVQRVVLRIEGGFNFHVELSRNAFQLVTQLDGRPIGEVVAELVENAVPEARDEFAQGALPVIRELFELGFLVRADQ